MTLPSFLLLVPCLALHALLLPLFYGPGCPCGPRSPTLDRLPWLCGGKPVRDGPVVSLRGRSVVVDENEAGSTLPVTERDRPSILPGVVSLLRRTRELWSSFHPTDPLPGVALMEIEQDTPALIVKSLVASAAAAGYGEVDFLVRTWCPPPPPHS
ncbi:MAG: hypothetical protein JRI23_11935 [Deltaproteobacteria bacterium]|jgi:hypothetical protein|nr:hypothetical protein [Deltaproteobacteria bacterium]MBW2532418.1 hypothetical protein [Deltaproteobacteria bacterium]